MDFRLVTLIITLSNFLFSLNINFYKLDENEDKIFKHYSNIQKDINDPKYDNLLVLYENDNHYSLITFKEEKKIKHYSKN